MGLQERFALSPKASQTSMLSITLPKTMRGCGGIWTHDSKLKGLLFYLAKLHILMSWHWRSWTFVTTLSEWYSTVELNAIIWLLRASIGIWTRIRWLRVNCTNLIMLWMHYTVNGATGGNRTHTFGVEDRETNHYPTAAYYLLVLLFWCGAWESNPYLSHGTTLC